MLETVKDALRRKETYILTGIMVLALLFRLYRIHDPFGGYLGYNEGYYANVAREYLDKPLIDLITQPLDLNNPPLFTMLLVIMFKLFGISEAVARIVPVVSSMIACLYSYLLASKLFNKTTGLVAAALLSVSPAFALLSINVQVDMLFVALILAGLYHYMQGRDSDRTGHMVAAGILFGLMLLTKLPGVIILAVLVVYETYRSRGAIWKQGLFRWAIGTTLGIACIWYGYQIVFNSSAFFSSQGHIAGVLKLPDLYFWKNLFIDELFWALNPLMFVLTLVGIPLMIKQTDNHDARLILGIMGGFTIFYIFYHVHSYYLLPLLPFSMIVIARLLDNRLRNRVFLSIATVSLYAVSAFFAALLLFGVKFGMTEIPDVRNIQDRPISNTTTIYADKNVVDNFLPLLEFYLPGARLVALGDKPAPKKMSDSIALVVNYAGPTDSSVYLYGIYPIYRHQYHLMLFGKGFYEMPRNMHQFTFGSIAIDDEGNVSDFGVTETPIFTHGFAVFDLQNEYFCSSQFDSFSNFYYSN